MPQLVKEEEGTSAGITLKVTTSLWVLVRLALMCTPFLATGMLCMQGKV